MTYELSCQILQFGPERHVTHAHDRIGHEPNQRIREFSGRVCQVVLADANVGVRD